MRQYVQYCLKRFDRRLWTARQIQHQALSPDAAYASAERRQRSFCCPGQTHLFWNPLNNPLGYGQCRFRSNIPGRDPRPSHGHHQIHNPAAVSEVLLDFLPLVRKNRCTTYLETGRS